jgi:uncharacterized membrane protein
VSLRVYTGPHSDRRRRQGGAPRLLPWLFALAAIGLEIAYPLVHGTGRRDLTVAIVVVFFLASASHALLWRGVTWTVGFLVITVGGGLVVEAVGTRAGVPFGDYTYTGHLSSTVFGVPWVVPLAWAMFAYPSLVLARRISRSALVVPVVGAFTLAAWDLFLDPMMTAEGFWRFSHPTPFLAHVPGVPVVNYVGWFLTGLVMMVLIDQLPRRIVPDGQPAVLFFWTFASSVVGNVFFFHRPWVAVYGGIAMVLVAVPYAWSLWTGRD